MKVPIGKRYRRSMRSLALALSVGVLVVACGGGSGSSSSSAGSGGPITVGYMMPISGPFAALGKNEQNGWNLAMNQAGGASNGHQIKTLFADNQFDPTVAVNLAKQLVEVNNVNIIEGPADSASILALVNYLGPKGVPTDDVTLCASQQIDAYKKYSYGLSGGWVCPEELAILGNWAATEQHYRHVTIVGLDNAFGWVSVGAFIAAFKKAGGTIDKLLWAPGTATDFAPYISQIPSSTDAVLGQLSGNTAVQFMLAYQQFGLKGKIPLMGGGVLTDQSIVNAEGGAALGVYAASNYCEGSDSAATAKFVAAYKFLYGVLPGQQAENAYTHAQLLIGALKTLGSKSPTYKNLLEALKSTKIEAPNGTLTIDPHYFAPIQTYYVCQVKTVDGVRVNVPVKTYANEPITGPLLASDWQTAFTHDSSARPSP